MDGSVCHWWVLTFRDATVFCSFSFLNYDLVRITFVKSVKIHLLALGKSTCYVLNLIDIFIFYSTIRYCCYAFPFAYRDVCFTLSLSEMSANIS